MDIPSKNSNQSSVLVTVPHNKASNQLFKSDILNHHVSTNNKDVSIPTTKKGSRHTKNKRKIPQKQNVDIPSKNSNQSSVLVTVPCNKASNQLFNSDTVNDHVSIINKYISIPKQIRISTYPKKNDIPQKQNVNKPSKNSNQSSVLVTVPHNKISNQLFKSDILNHHVLTNNKDVSIPNKHKSMSTYQQQKSRHTSKIKCGHTFQE